MLGVLPVIQGQARAAVWQGAGSAVCDEFTVSGAGSTGAGGASCPSAWGNPAGEQARAVVAARGGVGSLNDAQARETGQGLPRAGTARQAASSANGLRGVCLSALAGLLSAPKSGARCAVGRPRSSICPPARLASAFALVLAGAFPVAAETWSAGRGQSSVELRATEAPGAVAEVYFWNSSSDAGGRITHRFTLTHDGLTITGEAELGLAAPDTVRIAVPDGFIAVPDELTIPDGSGDTILIYPITAVGM
jgi:hypothetical protein